MNSRKKLGWEEEEGVEEEEEEGLAIPRLALGQGRRTWRLICCFCKLRSSQKGNFTLSRCLLKRGRQRKEIPGGRG